MFNSIIGAFPAVWQMIVCLIVTLAMGFLFSTLFCLTKKIDGYSKDVAITYVVMPVIICALSLILTYAMGSLIQSEEATRYGRVLIALLAVFMMIRFRSKQKSLEELTYIFFLTAVGLCNGLGYLAFSTVLYAIVTCVMLVLHFVRFPFEDRRGLSLKITIPEDLNYENVFDGVMKEYTDKSILRKVKTKDMGTMFLLTYYVHMKKGASMKDFTDKIRELNGNLDICITSAAIEHDE